MTSNVITLFRFNDNTVTWRSMEQATDGEFVDTGVTVTMTLMNNASPQVAIAGATNLALNYVTGSNGEYQGTIPYNIDWATLAPAGSGYSLVIVAVGTGHAKRILDCIVVERTT